MENKSNKSNFEETVHLLGIKNDLENINYKYLQSNIIRMSLDDIMDETNLGPSIYNSFVNPRDESDRFIAKMRELKT